MGNEIFRWEQQHKTHLDIMWLTFVYLTIWYLHELRMNVIILGVFCLFVPLCAVLFLLTLSNLCLLLHR